MGSLNLPTKQIIKNLCKKLKLENIRSTQETYGDFYLDGKFQFTVKMPNIHGGSNRTPSPGLIKACRNSVFLRQNDFADLVRCPMKADDYDAIIRGKIEQGLLY